MTEEMARVINAAGRGYEFVTSVEMDNVNHMKETRAYVCISAEACAAEGKDMEENAGVEGDGRDYEVRGVRGRSGRKVCDGSEGSERCERAGGRGGNRTDSLGIKHLLCGHELVD